MYRRSMLILLFTLLSSTTTLAAPATTSDFVGKTYLNVTKTEIGGLAVESRVTLNQVAVHDANLELSGTITYNNSQYPFNFTGMFYKSRLGEPSDKVAELSDTTNTFSVLHMAVRRNPAPEALIVSKMAKGPTLFLYVQRQGTREVTFVEARVNGSAQSLLALLQNQREEGQFSTDYWPQRVLDATNITSGSLTTAAVETSVPRNFNQTYSMGNGCNITYQINYRGYSNGPSDIARGAGEFNNLVEITRKWTDSNCAYYRTESSPYQLGTYNGPISVKVVTGGNGSNSGEVLLKGRYNGTFSSRTYPGSAYINLGLGYAFASINYSIPLCCQKSVAQNEEYIFSSSGPNNWTKLAKYTYTDRNLQVVGHRFQAIVQIAWGMGPRGLKSYETQWTVPIYQEGYPSSPITTDVFTVPLFFNAG